MGNSTVSKLALGETNIVTPIFFPSISSVKTTLRAIEYLEILVALHPSGGQFLVSAYDLSELDSTSSTAADALIARARAANVCVLMDSGNYESYWKATKQHWKQESFHAMLEKYSPPLAFMFDEQDPPRNTQEHLAVLFDQYYRDSAVNTSTTIIPIIHDSAGELPTVCSMFAARTNCPMIAVPERRLGEGIFERARTVSAIRLAFEEKGLRTAIHLLGTGNPLSIAIYAVSGAHSFDGLEWCQTSVDFETGLLHHFSQADFFSAQSAWREQLGGFQASTLAHNLQFYFDWMSRLRLSVMAGEGVAFCRQNFEERFFGKISASLGWEKQSGNN